MTSDDIIWVTDDGEARCARCRDAIPAPGQTLCEACGGWRVTEPALMTCDLCGVDRCWPGHRICPLCIAVTCNPPPAGCSADCATCKGVKVAA